MPFVKGYKWSDKQKKACGFKKEYSPWNKGKVNVYSDSVLNQWKLKRKGKESYFKGKSHTEESIAKIRESLKNHIRKGPKGKPWSKERRDAQTARNGKPYKKCLFRKSQNPRKSQTPTIVGGKKYHPLWHIIRKQVYRRDSWICQECGVHCHNSNKNKIQCHHIDYDITNNALSNLITLCASCHCKTNFKRKDWELHYKNLKEGEGATEYSIALSA